MRLGWPAMWPMGWFPRKMFVCRPCRRINVQPSRCGGCGQVPVLVTIYNFRRHVPEFVVCDICGNKNPETATKCRHCEHMAKNDPYGILGPNAKAK